LAVSFAGEGADVVVTYRDSRRGGEATAQAVRKAGREALLVRADVGEEAQVDRLFATCEERFGRVDILVNNAGITPRKPFWEFTLEEWQTCQNTNLRSVFLCTRFALRSMPEGGAILNVSSIHAARTLPHFAVYAASKGGMESLTRGMALDLAERRIRVNALRLGWVQVGRDMVRPGEDAYDRACERIPVGRPGTVEDVAGAAILLCSGASDYVTGAVWNLDGGQSVPVNAPYPRGFVPDGARAER
jgi:NAD(P)-dependent dehydrogenase (short-subunit alcohol dehydrogenase family)